MFPAFYGIATPEGAALFDESASLFVALTQDATTPGNQLTDEFWMGYETTDLIEQRDMEGERARTGPTFKKIELPHQRRIATCLFAIVPATG